LKLDEDTARTVEVAALLHDIGKIGLPDEILRKDERLMSSGERALLRQHPVLGQAALQMVDSLEAVGVLVRHHHERWDGKGYPDSLRGEVIPLGSRILAIADALDHYQGLKSGSSSDFVEAQLKLGQNGAFDPITIAALKNIIESSPERADQDEVAVNLQELREGMMLSRDLSTTTGILLIPKGEVVKRTYLYKLKLYETHKLVPSTAFVYRRKA
jgi:response regulator RpfG family c-di-GMP phosphodiesterase